DQTEPVGYKTLIGLALSLLCLARCASTRAGLFIITTTSSGALEQIPAELLKPDGSGPFPPIVIMHDCSGLGPVLLVPPTVGQKSSCSEAISLSSPTASPHATTLPACALTHHRTELKSVLFAASVTPTRLSITSARCPMWMAPEWALSAVHTAE